MSAALPLGWAVPDKPRFTLGEVAEVTGFSKKSLENGCRAGKVPHLWWGRQRVMSRDQVIAFIASCEVKVESRPKTRVVGLSKSDADRVAQHRDKVAARMKRNAA